MTPEQTAAITTPEPAWAQRARAAREYQANCDAMETDMRDRAMMTEAEIAEHFAVLQDVRLRTQLFASGLLEASKRLKMVSTPYHPEDILKHIQEVVGEVLGLTAEALAVMTEPQS